MRKNFLISGIVILIFLVPFIASKQVFAGVPGDPSTWEVGLPDLPGMPSFTETTWPAGEKLTLGYVITYIFTFALLIVGVVALLMLIVSAVRYMMSSAFPAGKVAALEQIKNIGLGLLLIMGAYLLLNTINPELLIFGLEEADMPGMISALGSITLYIEQDLVTCPPGPVTPDCCSETDDRTEELYNDGNLNDNPGWNDQTTHFQISEGLIARICTDAGYGSCTIYIGDGSCMEASAEGFAPGAPTGISAVKGEGIAEYTRLILFDDADQEGDSQVFSEGIQCRPVTGDFTGNSYCLYRELGTVPPPPDPQIYQTILCRERNWNNCLNEINPGAGALTCANIGGTGIASMCVYKENPITCIGALINEGGDYDFVPYTQLTCKNLSIPGAAMAQSIMVGDGCAVTTKNQADCEGTTDTNEGDDGLTQNCLNPTVSAIGGIFKYSSP